MATFLLIQKDFNQTIDLLNNLFNLTYLFKQNMNFLLINLLRYHYLDFLFAVVFISELYTESKNYNKI